MCRPTWDTSRSIHVLRHGAVTLYGCASQHIVLTILVPHRSPATPASKPAGLGSSAFVRHYLRNLGWFLFLELLRCFTSLGVALQTYVFSLQWQGITPDGLLHSDISGSKLLCSSPKLFAAYRVLHRLLMPRHPSCALCSLTTKKIGVYSSLKVSTHMGFSKVVLPACMAFFLFSLQFLLSLFFNDHQICKSIWIISRKMVGVLGFEPRTSSLSGTRSNQLSYTPISAASLRGKPHISEQLKNSHKKYGGA